MTDAQLIVGVGWLTGWMLSLGVVTRAWRPDNAWEVVSLLLGAALLWPLLLGLLIADRMEWPDNTESSAEQQEERQANEKT